jgi:hypothetical protein
MSYAQSGSNRNKEKKRENIYGMSDVMNTCRQWPLLGVNIAFIFDLPTHIR